MKPTEQITLDTWVTSDSHWEHPNIGRYQDRPANHFTLMREKWIELVQPEDVILHLGDIVCFGEQANHLGWIEGLPGTKLLLLGNHDKHKKSWYEEAGFTVLGRKPFLWHRPDNGDTICFSHEPETESGEWAINVHGHIHLNPHHEHVDRQEDRRNVCVEITYYAPMRLSAVLDSAYDNRIR